MSETIVFTKDSNKLTRYTELMPQLEALFQLESDLIANMANFTAVLKEVFGFFWIGFYVVKGNELVLGPFQGSLACTRIAKAKGVCGKAWEKAQSIIVPDVNNFEGHIACSALSRSEVVVPVFKNNKVIAVLDVDSCALNDFDEEDVRFLERMVQLLFRKG